MKDDKGVRMKNMVRILVMAVLILSFYTLYAARYTLSYAAEEQKVAARVNGVPITEAELEKATDAYIKKVTYHGGISEEKRQEYRKTTLDLLIEGELLFQEAKSRGITVKKEDIDKIIKETKKQFKDKKDFDKALKAEGITLNEYKEILRRNDLIKKLLKVEVEDKAKYSDRELEDYYNANKEKFLRPEGFRVRHMLFKVSPDSADEEDKIKEKAMDILKRVKAGEDFSELAYNYSDTAYKVKGGDLGWVHKGRLEPEIEDAAFKLNVGEVSELVETTYGYHIVKLEEKKPPEQLGFSEVKDSLKKGLETKKHKELTETLIKTLKEKAVIKIQE